LFLDEPTTGLDPQSRRELWEIIRGFRTTGRTVLLTTHYMDEAERLCDRVAIVDHGKLMALDTPRQLIASLGGEHIIEFSCSANGNGENIDPARFSDLPAVTSARAEQGGVSLSVAEPHIALPALMGRLAELHCELTNLTTRHASLEDVFVKFAGRHLADADAEAIANQKQNSTK
jgi:ABC-2 type transport system ATP-binding protein